MKAVILAAGVGTRLLPLTADMPKALVKVGGTPLLIRTLDRLAEAGIAGADVIVVSGYREDVLRSELARAGRSATVVTNPRFDTWNNFWSLYVAREAVGDAPFLQLDGDVLFDAAVLPRVLGARGPALLAVDVRPDLDAETMKVEATGPAHKICAVAKTLDAKTSLGEFIGISRVDAACTRLVFTELARLAEEGLTHEYYEHAYHRLAQRGDVPFHAVDVSGCVVTEIDNVEDLHRAEDLLASSGSR